MRSPHTGFTPEQCEAARKELQLEIGRRNAVEEYFGPKGLQAPFLGGAQVAALVDIEKLADQIKNAVKPPENSDTATNVFNILGFIVKAGALIPGGSNYAAALGGAFAVAAYLTNLTFVMTDPRSLGQRHVIAVGARDTVGTLLSAYVPAPPDSLTGVLFRAPDSPQGGGIRLYKLQFYSPQNFEMFPRVLLNRVACSSVPDPPGNSG